LKRPSDLQAFAGCVSRGRKKAKAEAKAEEERVRSLQSVVSILLSVLRTEDWVKACRILIFIPPGRLRKNISHKVTTCPASGGREHGERRLRLRLRLRKSKKKKVPGFQCNFHFDFDFH